MKHKAIYIFLFCVTISFTVLCCIQYVKQKDLRLINEELRKEVTKNNFLHALLKESHMEQNLSEKFYRMI